MRLATIFTTLLLFLSLGHAAAAEFYRYTDKQGNVLYTDDASKIPADQRESAKIYEGSIEAPKPAPPTVEDETADDETLSETERERRRLEIEEKKLDLEYKELMKQRVELESLKKKAITPDDFENYNKRIVEYNARATALQEKLDAHEEKVKEFTEKIKEETKAPEEE